MKILVNRNLIAKNKKENTNLPVISVKRNNKTEYTDTVNILDKDGNTVATIMYRPDKPLSCGASVWIEVIHAVDILDPKFFEELK